MAHGVSARMMLSIEDVKEELSVAYLLAVASSIQCSVELTRKDRDSIDARILGKGYLTKDCVYPDPSVSIQLKATSSISPKNGTLPLKISVKNHAELCYPHSLSPRLLVVLLLPDLSEEWIDQSDAELMIRRCAYCVSLRGAAPTRNKHKITVHVSMENRFSPQLLRNYLERCGRGEFLKHN